MFFPIGDDNVKGGAPPFFSYLFLGLNALVFLYQLYLLPQAEEALIMEYAVIPNDITQGSGMHTLITSMFLHGSWSHLLGNMLYLWIFADNIEAIMGNAKFLLFYVFGGIIAAGAQVLTDPGSLIPTIGASGAISAVMGAYLVMFPGSRIKVIFLLFFLTFYVPALLFLGFWILQQLYSGWGTLGSNTQGGVAWWAHIGGFIFGLAAGWLYKAKAKIHRQQEDLV
jgi:membrane associated rhomboid family serine protease